MERITILHIRSSLIPPHIAYVTHTIAYFEILSRRIVHKTVQQKNAQRKPYNIRIYYLDSSAWVTLALYLKLENRKIVHAFKNIAEDH